MTATDVDPVFQKFESQARECEAFASSAPAAYRRHVILLAVLGYAFPPAALALLVAIFVGVGWLYFGSGLRGGAWLIGKLGIALAVVIAMVVRAMWPSFEEPDGIRLKRSGAPALFSLVDEIRAKAGRPRVDRVYLTDDMNAAVRQTPRLGLFGWYRNDLILGLALLQALTKQELAAVLAHEFGHLSGAHGKLGAWIYRSRLLMARILGAIEERSYFGSWLFHWFYRWYEPYFAAYSFALAREQEYEADRTAAKAVSGQAAVDALARSSIAARYVGGFFWGKVWSGADSQAKPPEDVYDRLGEALDSLSGWAGGSPSFEAALAATTDYSDTHPSLSDRAAALGQQPRLPPEATERAVSLLPEGGQELAANLSRKWRTYVTATWENSHRELSRQRRRLADLDEKAEQCALSEDDALARGYLAERFRGLEPALERFEQAATWSKGAPRPLFEAGRILLMLGRAEGLARLDQAMNETDDAIVAACELAEDYLTESGRTAEAEAYRSRRKAQEAILQDDWTDRERVALDDTFVDPQYGVERVNEMASRLGRFKKKGLKRAWLVQKVTKHRQREPAYFLICEIGAFKRWTEDMNELQAEIAQSLAGSVDLRVVACDVQYTWLRDKAMATPGAQVFPQP